MHDVRKGMGLHESVDYGQFRAIFVTGGPGSGKDVILREAIAASNITELNFTQALDILNDKHKLAMKSMNPKCESVRNRGPLIINGPADDIEKINHIKEELEELGYSTMMIFVSTDNRTSQERNSLLSRMMVESVRQDKWLKSQENNKRFTELFENFVAFDNTGNLDTKEEDINTIYQSTKLFLDAKVINETVEDWLNRNSKYNINKEIRSLFKEENVKKDSKSIQLKTIGKYNASFRAKGPADIKGDNSGSLVSGQDQIKGDTGPRKDPNGKGHSGGAWHGVYSTEEGNPTLKINPPAKEPNFQKDNDKEKIKKRGDKATSSNAGRIGRPDGVGQTYDSRAGGQSAAAGAGLSQNLYGESENFSNDDVSNFAAQSGAVQANPLSSAYEPKKSFDKFRKKIKKEAIDHYTVDMGVGGTLGGAGNKEGMDSYFDQQRNIGLKIKRKINKKFNQSKDDGKDGQ
jgi:predicted kinase